MTPMRLHDTRHVERALLAQVVHSRMDADEAADSLLELGRLADTAGLEVAGQLTQNRERPDGGTLFGTGKVEDLKALVAEKAANTVIFDNALNAIQSYNLAKALGVRIMDRNEIILEIETGGGQQRQSLLEDRGGERIELDAQRHEHRLADRRLRGELREDRFVEHALMRRADIKDRQSGRRLEDGALLAET